DDDLPDHSTGFMHRTCVLIGAHNLEGVAESSARLQETGIERLGPCGTSYVAAIYRHGWIGGRMMHLVTDVAPFDGVAYFDSYGPGLESRRHVQHLDRHDLWRRDCGSFFQKRDQRNGRR